MNTETTDELEREAPADLEKSIEQFKSNIKPLPAMVARGIKAKFPTAGDAFIAIMEGRAVPPSAEDEREHTERFKQYYGPHRFSSEVRPVALTSENAHVVLWLNDGLCGEMLAELRTLLFREWCSANGMKSVESIWHRCGKAFTKVQCAAGTHRVRQALGAPALLGAGDLRTWRLFDEGNCAPSRNDVAGRLMQREHVCYLIDLIRNPK